MEDIKLMRCLYCNNDAVMYIGAKSKTRISSLEPLSDYAVQCKSCKHEYKVSNMHSLVSASETSEGNVAPFESESLKDIIKFHDELSDNALDFYGAAKAYYCEKGYADFDKSIMELFKYFKSEKQKAVELARPEMERNAKIEAYHKAKDIIEAYLQIESMLNIIDKLISELEKKNVR